MAKPEIRVSPEKMEIREKVAIQLGVLKEKAARMAQIQRWLNGEPVAPLEAQSGFMIQEIAAVFKEIRALDEGMFLILMKDKQWGPTYQAITQAMESIRKG